MKRRRLLKRLSDRGCVIVREGRRYAIIMNPANGTTSQVPRHREVKTTTAGAFARIWPLSRPPNREANSKA